ncbi:DUF397 domain-containing protein [Micromonospora noduli]|uniref:DUF397 domain-containing protein n=1 Tax=Micromonospora noduli TaxID=709876 RepID=A0A328N268_9ACTN|nr:DUF397 domain-containing protein [Micromonospora noduli]RAO00788.1 hypothetical protein LAH08_03041 [Micromonospora noduli]
MEEDRNSHPIWTRRSSRCQNDHCVDVSRYPTTVEVCNSAATHTLLSFSNDSWRNFLHALGNNTLQLPNT